MLLVCCGSWFYVRSVIPEGESELDTFRTEVVLLLTMFTSIDAVTDVIARYNAMTHITGSISRLRLVNPSNRNVGHMCSFPCYLFCQADRTLCHRASNPLQFLQSQVDPLQ